MPEVILQHQRTLCCTCWAVWVDEEDRCDCPRVALDLSAPPGKTVKWPEHVAWLASSEPTWGE